MGYNFFEVLGKIAGIGGISIGLVLVIFRQTLAKSIFPNLNQKQAFRLLRLIIILTFTVAVIGILAWLYSDYLKNKKDDSKIGIVDVVQRKKDSTIRPKAVHTSSTLSELSLSKLDFRERDDTTTILEIKMRNTGEQPAYLKSAIFHVKHIVALYDGAHYTNIQISANYDIELPTKKSPYSVTKEINQLIPAGGVDRFTFTVTSHYKGLYEFSGNIYAFIYIADIEFVYDEDNKSISMNDIGFSLRKEVRMSATTYASFEEEDLGVSDANIMNETGIKLLSSKYAKVKFTATAITDIQIAKKMLHYKRTSVAEGDSVVINLEPAGYKYARLVGPFISDANIVVIYSRDTGFVTMTYRYNLSDTFFLYRLNADLRKSLPRKIVLGSSWSKDGRYGCLKLDRFPFYIIDKSGRKTYRRLSENGVLKYSSPMADQTWVDSVETIFR